MTEDEMVGWHHGLNGHEFEQTLGDSEVKPGCSLWGRRVRHDIATEQQHESLPHCNVHFHKSRLSPLKPDSIYLEPTTSHYSRL